MPSSIKRRTHPVLMLAVFIFFSQQPSIPQQTSDVIQRPPHPGKLVDVGGWRLHLNCSGKNKGNVPTVVLESGAGDFSFDWALVQPGVARFTRICSYDRAGYAWSDPGPTPRTMQQVAYELHTALHEEGVRKPYVLVGHSIGGLLARVYAGQYREEVAGMVLVDSSHEDQLISMTDMKTRQEKIVRWRELSLGRAIPPVQSRVSPSTAMGTTQGTIRSSSQLNIEAPYDKLPSNIQQIRLWAMSQPNYTPARFSEFDFLPEELARVFADRSIRTYPLGDMPLIVLTRGVSEYSGTNELTKMQDEDRKQRQADLVNLSSNSEQIIAKNSGHHIQLDDPKLVIDAVRRVIEFARHPAKLRSKVERRSL
jgi:pimeloyl-ACP methyl ester carboxylesterase